MWKKDDSKPQEVPASPRPSPPGEPERPTAMARTPSGDRALIGRSITIRGDVSGDEDLVIQGCVEGSVDLTQHTVTVGSEGEVRADISGRVVTIEGRVVGNIDGGEQVTLRSSAYVQGDITAPRVVLENGARFRGLVDMGEVEDRPAHRGKDAEAKHAGNGRSAWDQSSAGATASAEASEEAGGLADAAADGSTNGKGKRRAGQESEPQLAS